MSEASTSKLANNTPSPTTDELLALTGQLVNLSKTDPIGQLFKQERQKDEEENRKLEVSLLEQAPSYIKLHNDIQSSKSLLGQLESFLDKFYSDLNVLSNQMSQLQSKSILLGQRLKNRRKLEGKLRMIVSDIVLEPQYIELIFADEATAGKAGLEVWKGCAERLSACLRACTELESDLRDELGMTNNNASIDAKALKEAREVAEGCRLMAASKIRPLLISTFAPLRSSLSTNMPILQAVLLKSYRPLFMFLSHHAPRIAIDVQRAYVAAARLYFETGFRRYERSLARLRDREKSKRSESSTSSVSFTEPAGKAAAGISVFGVGSSTTPATNANSNDPWSPDISQLDNAKVADGPAVTLAYLADDATYRAPIEALFRSLSLTFLDNASSEYCFLARFFEGIDLDAGGKGGREGGSSTGSQITGSSAVKVRHSDADDKTVTNLNEDEGPLPEDSASIQDDLDEENNRANEEEAQGTVTKLSSLEKARVRGRGALDELWKQVMEPVVGTYTKFANSIIDLHPSLIPLYTMVKLNDHILAEIETRGVNSVLQGTFMTFKLKAWPMVQKQFDEAIESVKKLRLGGTGLSGGAGVAAAASNLFGGFFGGIAGTTAEPNSSAGSGESGVQLVCARYARLYSIIVHLNSFYEDGQDMMVFTSLSRLRGEVEGLLDSIAKNGGINDSVVTSCYRLIRSTIEAGPAGISLPRIQSEMSHWTEAERSRRHVGK